VGPGADDAFFKGAGPIPCRGPAGCNVLLLGLRLGFGLFFSELPRLWRWCRNRCLYCGSKVAVAELGLQGTKRRLQRVLGRDAFAKGCRDREGGVYATVASIYMYTLAVACSSSFDFAVDSVAMV
jgi:hypothetical protein